MNSSRWNDFDHRWLERLGVADRPGHRRRAAIILAHSGDSWFWLAGLGILWLTAHDPWRAWAAKMALSILALAVIVMIIKFSIRRERPAGEWGAIYRRSDPHSFPSGHAARAVMLAVLAIGWGPAWLAVLLALWAPLVSLARVLMGLHYPTDVIAGGAIGLLGGVISVLLFP
jgi:undecaprenyl-diphosphatase